MKLYVYSKWKGRIAIPARVNQFTRAARLCGKESFKDYAGILKADSERLALEDWLDNVTTLKISFNVPLSDA